MKLNQGKCDLLVAVHKYESIWSKIGETKIWEYNRQMLQGVQIDKKLSFDKQVLES